MSTLDDFLTDLPGRCPHGYHPKQRHSCTNTPSLTPAAATAEPRSNGWDLRFRDGWSDGSRSRGVGEGSEWTLFVSVLRKVTRADGTIHQGDVRPLIRGRIPAKHIGQLWKRARNDGLIVDTGDWERSTDVEGRNGDKQCRIYRLAAQRGRPAA